MNESGRVEARPSDVLYFVAGEASGDNHGAAVMRALRNASRQLNFAGRGGPAMQAAAGSAFANWISDAAVIGLWEVVKKYRYFRAQFRETIAEIERTNPRAVVLIDYPGFNLRLARALRRKFPSLKIIYYISPQVWAWNRGRIASMGRVLDLMLCIFPFEAELYNTSGLRTVFVGHPLTTVPSEAEGPRGISGRAARTETGSLGFARDDERDLALIAILPGSRQREVRKILPVMLNAVHELRQRDSQLQFEIAAASQDLAVTIVAQVSASGLADCVQTRTGAASSLLQRAGVGMIASGTATLEAAITRLPFVLVYRVAWLTYFAARLVVKVKYLGMPNVLAGREIIPEFVQHRARGRDIAAAVRSLLDDGNARREQLVGFESVAAMLGTGDASENAAREILRELQLVSS